MNLKHDPKNKNLGGMQWVRGPAPVTGRANYFYLRQGEVRRENIGIKVASRLGNKMYKFKVRQAGRVS
jgi:hypothetical protein